MSDRLHIATRKGLFTYAHTGGHWKIENTAFLGDPVSNVLHDTRDDTLYAALNLGHFGCKLQRSDDGGKSWTEVGVPTYPQNPEETATREQEGDAAKAPSLKQIWCMETGAPDQKGMLWAGTIPGGLFRSADRGESWELVRSLWDRPERAEWFGGGYDQAGIHSICVDPRASNKVTVAISVGGVWRTEDNAETWNVIGRGMFAEFMPPEQKFEPKYQDPHRMVQCHGDPDHYWIQHHNGVFRSTNDALKFEELRPEPAVFGFGVAVHPTDPLTAWLVPGVKDECRIPVDGKMVVNRTRDGGKSWESLREGLPQEHAYDLVYRHALDVDSTGGRIALGSTTGSVWISEDQGDAFQTLSHHLPPVYAVRFVR